jgi:RNA polymerase II subunit A C-terminal domain phosphatase
MAMERASVRLPLRVLADAASWTLSSWLVAPGATVYRNQRVAALQSPSTGAVDHALAPHGGRLARTLVAEGASVNTLGTNVVIAVIEFCPHSVVFQGLCGVCGEEVTVGHFADVSTDVTARLPVAYNARTLSVTRAEAESISSVTARQLLKERRLLLVLDLDHTLVHATDDPRAAAVLHHSPEGCDTSSIASFSLAPLVACDPPGGPPESRMHLKLRPHLSEFLGRCAERFELHIYTMGSRPYADRVAQLIDPDKRLFSGRITSREDFEEGRSNQKNISRLFPCDDSMVLIIDDREDVWVSGTGASFMPNLIRAKPYTFWNGLHEAYDRALAAGAPNAASPAPNARPFPPPAAVPASPLDGAVGNVDDAGHDSGGEWEAPKEAPACDAEGSAGGAREAGKCHSPDVDDVAAKLPVSNGAGPEEPMPVLSEELRRLVRRWWENDSSAQGWNNHLQRLADVLETCHARFFETLPGAEDAGAGQGSPPMDIGGAPPLSIPADVKSIVAGIRSQVLSGCVLTFTGVIPLTTAPELSAVWELAARHGAVCRKEFTLGETTHVVASAERALNTEKTRLALESRTAFVVDVLWLEDSTIQFERRPELLYSLQQYPAGVTWEELRSSVGAVFATAKIERQGLLAAAAEAEAAAAAAAAAAETAELRVAGADSAENGGGAVARARSGSVGGGESPPPRKVRKVASKRPSGEGARVLDADEVDEALDEAFL